MWAVGKADARSIPDTATIVTTERDWLKGDTILAVFDTTQAARAAKPDSVRAAATPPVVAPPAPSAPPPSSAVDMAVTSKAPKPPAAPRDTTKKSPPIKSLRATTNAYAYYHVANSDKIKDKPGINYVRGRVIDLLFVNREVSNVTVLDQASGVYLEAITDTTKKAAPKKPLKPKAPAIPRAPRGFPRGR